MVKPTQIHASYAQLPAPPDCDDRLFLTDNAVIVLDGASAFTPQSVPAATYADTLGRHMAARLAQQPNAPLRDCLRYSIRVTADSLDLRPGPTSPSSTVAVARVAQGHVDLLCLGDTLIVHPRGQVLDDRLSHIATEERRTYRDRLANGYGYDNVHARLLRALQDAQRRYRNRPSGYWIAEANPDAAEHALTAQVPFCRGDWVLLATDGAYRALGRLRPPNWPQVAAMTPGDLRAVLEECQSWEARADPDGQLMPRAKQHDDKTLTVINHPGLSNGQGM